jgi:hypothetical protein
VPDDDGDASPDEVLFELSGVFSLFSVLSGFPDFSEASDFSDRSGDSDEALASPDFSALLWSFFA